MLAPLPDYGRSVSLIPQSCVQFLDFGLNLGSVGSPARSFWERSRSDAPERFELRFLETDEAGELRDVETGETPPEERRYSVKAAQAVETFLGQWLPLPYFRVTQETLGSPSRFAKGPSNWCRVRIVELDEPDAHGNTHRVSLAFDTELLPESADRPYLAPSPEDARSRQLFAMAAHESHNSWFLAEDWVDEWLEELFAEAQVRRRGPRRARPGGADAPGFPYCQHWAHYLTLLRVLEELETLPHVWMVNLPQSEPIDVDLVLDVGNSRTCGILIESSGDEYPDLNNSFALELRDLTHPERIYRGPCETRVEFALPQLGRQRHSMRGGRARALSWPSVTRIGPEAASLVYAARGTEGNTGMSSPKRYLWDERPRRQEWRFNHASPHSASSEPAVRGVFVQFVQDDGALLGETGMPAMRARYSRSSLMAFALSEVLLQTLVLINSPARRSDRAHSEVPRRLRKIMMTMPAAMPLEERRLFAKRAADAVDLTWQSLGWNDEIGPEQPKVELHWDEATCTQLVYLYTEVTEKFQGSASRMLETLGRAREGYGPGPSLRVASLDIGGGTTDLIVSTYVDQSERDKATAAIVPRQNFREGFNIAGDDILKGVIELCVIPELKNAIEAAGVLDAHALLDRLLGADFADQTQVERALRKKIANQILVPIALGLIHHYERCDLKHPDEGVTRRFGDFFQGDDVPSEQVIGYLEEQVAKAGGSEFRVRELEFAIDLEAIDKSVRSVIQPILGDLCEVIHAYDCDVLLLSGRPSRLPAVRSIMAAKLAVRPGRVQPMHRYRVGTWYPFRDSGQRIEDPKTTAAVGAMLCSLAEGSLEGFFLKSRDLELRSTARYIGEMERNGRIPAANVFFSNVDLDAEQAEPEEHVCEMYAPISIGARQLEIDRWPTLPLYRLEFADPESARRLALPLRVPVARRQSLREEDDELMKERFEVVDGVEDAEGNPVARSSVVLRLQTLRSEGDGYWLDTGVFEVI